MPETQANGRKDCMNTTMSANSGLTAECRSGTAMQSDSPCFRPDKEALWRGHSWLAEAVPKSVHLQQQSGSCALAILCYATGQQAVLT